MPNSEIKFKGSDLPANSDFRKDLRHLLKKYGFEVRWESSKELTLYDVDRGGLTTSEFIVRELFSTHPALRDKAMNDGTVYAWFKQAELNRCTLEEALVGALVWVTQEKQKLFDQLVESKMKETS